MKPSPKAGGIQPHLEPLSGQLNPGTQQHSRHQPSRRQWLGAVAAVLSVSGLFGVSSLAHAQTADDLFTAVQRDDVSGLILLDLKGVNLNAINPRGQHALHIALQVPAAVWARIDAVFPLGAATGERYNASAMKRLETGR